MIRVVALDGQPIEQAEAEAKTNPEVIAHLERLLDRAKGGQVDTLAFVAWGQHGSDSGYAGIEEFGEGVYLLGLLSRLQSLVRERVDTLAAPVAEFVAPTPPGDRE